MVVNPIVAPLTPVLPKVAMVVVVVVQRDAPLS